MRKFVFGELGNSRNNNPAPFTQDGSDPRIDEIITNQKMIMSSLNSLTGLMKQLIQQQHTSIPLCSDKVVGDSVQVVSNNARYREMIAIFYHQLTAKSLQPMSHYLNRRYLQT